MYHFIQKQYELISISKNRTTQKHQLYRTCAQKKLPQKLDIYKSSKNKIYIKTLCVNFELVKLIQLSHSILYNNFRTIHTVYDFEMKCKNHIYDRVAANRREKTQTNDAHNMD
ncbi:hypothetical protein M758_UG044100 [Ceratodon purpureus]|nr:hypothetical protein M758_UG043400 [Ceratodon purpureus]KAG0594057.1 hypothetical protein M758_UG044100 [Ceratodon purpureus]